MTTSTLATAFRPVAPWRTSLLVSAAPIHPRQGEGRTPGLDAATTARESGRAHQSPDAGAQLPGRRDLTGAGAVATPGGRGGESRTCGGGSGTAAAERTSLFDIVLTTLLALAGVTMLVAFFMSVLASDWTAVVPLALTGVAWAAIRVLWTAIDESQRTTA